MGSLGLSRSLLGNAIASPVVTVHWAPVGQPDDDAGHECSREDVIRLAGAWKQWPARSTLARTRLQATALALAMLSTAYDAGAQIPDTEMQISVSAGSESDLRMLYGVDIGVLDADESVSLPDGRSYSAVAHALAGGGSDAPDDPPVADCDANIDATGQITAVVEAGASFIYYVKINGSPPPEVAVYFPPVYVRVSYHGETTLAGAMADTTDPFRRARATAGFALARGSPTPPGNTALSEQIASNFAERTAEFTGPRTILIPPGEREYPMRVVVACSLQFAVLEGGSAAGQAMADPIFEFDQEAFDEYAALNEFPTFRLADHYSFEYSPAMVPEPAQGAATAALVALAFVARSRRRSRDPARRFRILFHGLESAADPLGIHAVR